jgi:hypothetical protein
MFIEVTLFYNQKKIMLNTTYIEQFSESRETLTGTEIWIATDPDSEPYEVSESYLDICHMLGLK